MCYNIKKLQNILTCVIVRIMKDKKDKTNENVKRVPTWELQPRNALGHFLALDGSNPGKRIYTQNDLDREIAQAFLSGTKQSREVVNVTRPDLDTLKRAFLAGMNESKGGMVTPSVQFDRWIKRENIV